VVLPIGGLYIVRKNPAIEYIGRSIIRKLAPNLVFSSNMSSSTILLTATLLTIWQYPEQTLTYSKYGKQNIRDGYWKIYHALSYSALNAT